MSGEEGLKVLGEERPDLALLDVVLPGIDGIEVLRQFRKQSPDTIVVMMSAYRVVDRAVEAMKLGASTISSSPSTSRTWSTPSAAPAKCCRCASVCARPSKTAKGRYDFGRIVTSNQLMADMLEAARKTAEIRTHHDSHPGRKRYRQGRGRACHHYNSPRADKELLELNCASLPDTLLESEMFGYEPGAFTDARRRKEGLLERADGGTLFLDEIANMSANVQAKILRVLEEGTFMRLGGTKPHQG